MAHTKHDTTGPMLNGDPNFFLSTESKSPHERRLAALRAAQGLWKGRTDIPKDGVEYQEKMRTEWA